MQNACMTVITIRDVPDELNARLKAQAKARGQSVQAFLHHHLERIAEESRVEERLRLLLSELPRVEISEEDFHAAIEDFRSERDA